MLEEIQAREDGIQAQIDILEQKAAAAQAICKKLAVNAPEGQEAAAAEVVCGKLSEREVWKRERSLARWKKLAEQRKAAAAELAMLETHVKSS